MHHSVFTPLFVLAFTLCVSLGAVPARAQEASVSPPPDPYTGRRPSWPRMYLTNAGRPPHVELPLRAFKKVNICPDDYEMGFSIRCDVRNADKVVWVVNGKVHKEDMSAPYYVGPHWGRYVGPWKRLNFVKKWKKLRVGVIVPPRELVYVDLVKSC